MNKAQIIAKIAEIISKHGCFTTAEIQAESSPMINSLNDNIYQLAERFYTNHAETVIYCQGSELDTENVDYVKMTNAALLEILKLAKQYELSETE